MRRASTLGLLTSMVLGYGIAFAPTSSRITAEAMTPATPGCQTDAACQALVNQVGEAAVRVFARATVHALLAAQTVTANGFGAGTTTVKSYCDMFPGACGNATDGYPNATGKTGTYNNITDVPGVQAGEYTDPNVLTGTTAMIMHDGATVGVEVRGSAPGSRETDVVRDEEVAQPVNAVVLSGGSAYGLAAGDGVAQWLEQNHIGMPADNGQGVVPIVPEAIIFDPGRFGPFTVHPTASFGYAAAQNAHTGPLAEGNVGSGAGAEAGSVKGGLGFASEDLGQGLFVGAAVTINSVGDGYDPGNGCRFYAGNFQLDNEFAGVQPPPGGCGSTGVGAPAGHAAVKNTTVGVVATNLAMDKAMVNKLAVFGQDGMARAIRPSHTMLDGDTVFGIATGTISLSSPTTGVSLGATVPEGPSPTSLIAGALATGAAVLLAGRYTRRRLAALKRSQRRNQQ